MSRSEEVVDSDGRDAISSSEQDVYLSTEDTMYADVARDGLEAEGEENDMMKLT